MKKFDDVTNLYELENGECVVKDTLDGFDIYKTMQDALEGVLYGYIETHLGFSNFTKEGEDGEEYMDDDALFEYIEDNMVLAVNPALAQRITVYSVMEMIINETQTSAHVYNCGERDEAEAKMRSLIFTHKERMGVNDFPLNFEIEETEDKWSCHSNVDFDNVEIWIEDQSIVIGG